MKVKYIYPGDIGSCDEYSHRWVEFTQKLGYTTYTPSFIAIIIVEIDN